MLEFRATGRYFAVFWLRNGNTQGTPGFPVSDAENFAHFTEIYVSDQMTTLLDLGLYEVQLIAPPDFQQQGTDTIRFEVVEPGNVSVIVLALSCNKHIIRDVT